MSKGVELPSNRENLRYEIILQLCALYYQTIGKEIKTTDELNMSGRQGGLYKTYNTSSPIKEIESKHKSLLSSVSILFVILSGVRYVSFKYFSGRQE